MKKIGIFCGYYLPHMGGVERYVDKLSAELIKLGYEIVIVTSNHDGTLAEYVGGNPSVYRLPIHDVVRERYPIIKRNAQYKKLLGYIEAEEFDCVLVNSRFNLTSLVGSRLGKRVGCPVMLIEHGTDHFSVNNRFFDFFGAIYEHGLTQLLKKSVDAYYGVSQNCNRWLEHFSIHANGVFYNAIDVADRKLAKDLYSDSFRSEEIVITYAGRLIREKGIMNLLEAFRHLKSDLPTAKMRLVVAGNGELLETIRRDYSDPAIDILGKLDFERVMALYKRSDIFVYPSLYPEGLPTSILEAGLMSCAVIATPKGGTEEVITDNQHGTIVDGSIESLEAAIRELVIDAAMRKKLGLNIRRRVESHFNWKIVAQKVDQEITNFTMRDA